MRLRLIAVGQKTPAWIEAGFQTYYERFPPHFSLELIEIPAEKRAKNANITRIIQAEGDKILQVIKPSTDVIALEVKGSLWSTEKLALHLKNWQRVGKNIDFIIGGTDGLAPTCLQRANFKWSLSPLTFPHALVRILVIEQIYRAMCILQNHPYHRNRDAC